MFQHKKSGIVSLINSSQTMCHPLYSLIQRLTFVSTSRLVTPISATAATNRMITFLEKRNVSQTSLSLCFVDAGTSFKYLLMSIDYFPKNYIEPILNSLSLMRVHSVDIYPTTYCILPCSWYKNLSLLKGFTRWMCPWLYHNKVETHFILNFLGWCWKPHKRCFHCLETNGKLPSLLLNRFFLQPQLRVFGSGGTQFFKLRSFLISYWGWSNFIF